MMGTQSKTAGGHLAALVTILIWGITFISTMDFHLELAQFTSAVNIGNILFLGFGASALCFVTWSTAAGLLGAARTSVYIYLVPVVTVAASALVLREPLTPVLIIGAMLTLIGLWLSETKLFERGKEHGQPKHEMRHGH